LQIALLLMKHPAIPLHGSENHLVTGYSLLTALRNSGKIPIGEAEFEKAAERVRKVSPGVCGAWGVCGCAIAAGSVTSVITGATYLSDKERSLALKVAATILGRIARPGGPRCCKMSVYVAIDAAVASFDRELGISIRHSADPKPCLFSKLNAECLKRRCPYYGKERRGMETPGI
jgi:hypothetical protein